MFFLEPHGGDLVGFVLLRGDREALARLRAHDDFGRINRRAGSVVRRFGVVVAATGGELARRREEYGRSAADLTG